MLSQNLKYLRQKNKVSQQVLSDALGIPRTTLGDYERAKTEPNISMMIKMAQYFDLSLDQLLTKNLSLEQYEVLKTKHMKVLAISVNQEDEGNIELVDSKAEAGYLDSFQNPEYIRELPKLAIPDLPSGTYRAFQIQGDSMLPIESGSIIIASYVEALNEVKDGNTYIVISKRDGLVYKRIKTDHHTNLALLSSDNESYLPYKLPFEEIDELWKYYAHISFSDSKKELSTKVESQISDIQAKVNRIYNNYNN